MNNFVTNKSKLSQDGAQLFSYISQEEYASYGPTGGSGVQTFFDD